MKRIVIQMLMVTAFLTTLNSCRKESDDDAGGTATQAMAGEWWVQISVNNELLLPDYFKVLTYNTSENIPSKMWMDDLEQLWPFKIKMDVNPSNKTFNANASQSQYSDITVNLQNGKVLAGGSVGPFSKAVTDSIYVEAEFSDDPGTIYQLSGYRRTRFQEDDH
jgi:hypothetical protein